MRFTFSTLSIPTNFNSREPRTVKKTCFVPAEIWDQIKSAYDYRARALPYHIVFALLEMGHRVVLDGFDIPPHRAVEYVFTEIRPVLMGRENWLASIAEANATSRRRARNDERDALNTRIWNAVHASPKLDGPFAFHPHGPIPGTDIQPEANRVVSFDWRERSHESFQPIFRQAYVLTDDVRSLVTEHQEMRRRHAADEHAEKQTA